MVDASVRSWIALQFDWQILFPMHTAFLLNDHHHKRRCQCSVEALFFLYRMRWENILVRTHSTNEIHSKALLTLPHESCQSPTIVYCSIGLSKLYTNGYYYMQVNLLATQLTKGHNITQYFQWFSLEKLNDSLENIVDFKLAQNIESNWIYCKVLEELSFSCKNFVFVPLSEVSEVKVCRSMSLIGYSFATFTSYSFVLIEKSVFTSSWKFWQSLTSNTSLRRTNVKFLQENESSWNILQYIQFDSMLYANFKSTIFPLGSRLIFQEKITENVAFLSLSNIVSFRELCGQRIYFNVVVVVCVELPKACWTIDNCWRLTTFMWQSKESFAMDFIGTMSTNKDIFSSHSIEEKKSFYWTLTSSLMMMIIEEERRCTSEITSASRITTLINSSHMHRPSEKYRGQFSVLADFSA